MTNQSRQLAAIMFVDIKGFTKKMEEDEAQATIMRQKLDSGLKEHVPFHKGRIIKQTGDGALCLFHSDIEAVNAAIKVQLFMRQDPVVPVRIGIHSGDVMIDEQDIYGDGVNVASRVESFAFAGGIFISGKVYDEIKNQQDIKTLSLGKFEFTNVKDPVDVYAITNEGIAVPNIKKIEGKGVSAYKRRRKNQRSFALLALLVIIVCGILYATVFKQKVAPQKNTVAVMPFKNMSDSKDNDFFSDGITEDILTQISKINNLSVLSQSTTMQLKDNKKSVKELGEELKVGYILDGSVFRDLDSIKINTRLVDATTGNNVWAEGYTREYSKIFEIQSEIARYIANVLKTKLSREEKASINKKPTSNLTAYEHYLKGREHYYHVSKNENALAIDEFKTAISLDEKYTLAWAGLADTYSQKFRFGYPASWLDSGKIASEKAIGLDEKSSEAYKSLANYFLYNADYNQAKPLLLKAISLNPNNAAAIGNLGSCYMLSGQLDEALKWEKQSAVLEPKKFVPFYIVGWIYRLLGDYNKSAQWLNKAIELQPHTDAYRELGFTYIGMNKYREAKALLPRLISLDSSSADNFEIAGLITQMTGDNIAAAIYYQQALTLKPDGGENPEFYGVVGLAQAELKAGRKVDAEILLSRAVEVFPDPKRQASNNYDRYVYNAAAYAINGNKTQALFFLHKAIDANWIDYLFVEKNPWFDNIKNVADFKSMMQTLKEKAVKFKASTEKL